jgi:hypothetical protein
VGILSDLKTKFLGDKSTQNQPVIITGPGSSFEVDNSYPDPFTQVGDPWAAPASNYEAVQAFNNAHLPPPDPAQPAADSPKYELQPKSTLGKTQERFLITDPVSTTEHTSLWTDSPYRNPGNWPAEFPLKDPSTWRFNRQYQGPTSTFDPDIYKPMGSNIRAYPVGGMRATPTSRNTYRLNPDPWDETIVDMPTPTTPPDVQFTSPAVSPSSSAYRL